MSMSMSLNQSRHVLRTIAQKSCSSTQGRTFRHTYSRHLSSLPCSLGVRDDNDYDDDGSNSKGHSKEINMTCHIHRRTRKNTHGNINISSNTYQDMPTSIIQSRGYSTTRRTESATLVLGLGAMAAAAKAGQYTVTAYNEWKANQPEETQQSEDDDANANADDATTNANVNAKTNTGASQTSEKRENIFNKYFSVGSKYYEGGFEDKMTRREAALILGVRESSTAKRIKDAHRKLLILNHPDTGGSTFLSGKLNEAKELLLKGKRS
mmetsp:Transcript_16145/g.23603  ORF Transcript_16145/g.23603 Transcript_16145/m.23603 type:complete len:266 (+) Transcript_16145:1-798(+)